MATTRTDRITVARPVTDATDRSDPSGTDNGASVDRIAQAGDRPTGLRTDLVAKSAAFDALEDRIDREARTSLHQSRNADDDTARQPRRQVDKQDSWDDDAHVTTHAPTTVQGHVAVARQALRHLTDATDRVSHDQVGRGDHGISPTLPSDPWELPDIQLHETASSTLKVATLTLGTIGAAGSTDSFALAKTSTLSLNGVYNVQDYGATAGDATNDTAAIQTALNAAFAAGGGTVYIPTGVYIVSGDGNPTDGALRIGSNVTLHGDGMGQTELKLADGYATSVTGIIRTPIDIATTNVTITDLSINGNKANTPAPHVIGFFSGDKDPGQYASNLLLQRVEIHDMSGYGFDPHEQFYNVRILDSVAHDNGLD